MNKETTNAKLLRSVPKSGPVRAGRGDAEIPACLRGGVRRWDFRPATPKSLPVAGVARREAMGFSPGDAKISACRGGRAAGGDGIFARAPDRAHRASRPTSRTWTRARAPRGGRRRREASRSRGTGSTRRRARTRRSRGRRGPASRRRSWASRPSPPTTAAAARRAAPARRSTGDAWSRCVPVNRGVSPQTLAVASPATDLDHLNLLDVWSRRRSDAVSKPRPSASRVTGGCWLGLPTIRTAAAARRARRKP